MAAVSIPPSPHAIGTMASRRAPLSNLPNAGNSPYRAVASVMKRSRSQSIAAADAAQAPPAKKKIVEADEAVPNTPRRRTGQALLDNVAARNERTGATRAARQQKPDESLQTLRQWQNHYRKVFPNFVFYFDSVTDDDRRYCSRGIQALGGKQEKFFSKDVTHVITTRLMPSEPEPAPAEPFATSAAAGSVHDGRQPRTINPSLLEKHNDHLVGVPRSKFTFEQPSVKRIGQEHDVRKQPTNKIDILHKAKEMNMKIWQVEKLQRILTVILDEPTSPQDANPRNNVSRAHQGSRPTRQPDLSQLIKNEQMNGTAEREASLVHGEIVPFKGPHIYIRDMNEKSKPIMVREYPKVANRDDGEWPQFRSVSMGKCPFIEEDSHSRRQAEKAQVRQARQKATELAAPRTRSTAAAKMEPPPYAGRKRPLAEVENNANANAGAQVTQQLPAPATENQEGSKPAATESQNATVGQVEAQNREPMASGLQASNITSAIRSQMISSTAAGPGAKAGTSKEIHGLQRKVLERNNSGSAAASLIPSRRMTDIAGAARGSTRAAKTKAQEKLGLNQIQEDEQPTEELDPKQAAGSNSSKVTRKEKKDFKPGYCENCREKFEDFDEHVGGKRHRKFALTKDNWRELDELLSLLGRPLRDDPDFMQE